MYQSSTVHNPLYFISHIPLGNVINIYIVLHPTLRAPSLNAIFLYSFSVVGALFLVSHACRLPFHHCSFTGEDWADDRFLAAVRQRHLLERQVADGGNGLC